MAIVHERADAVRIAKALLERRLVAGFNLLPVDSAFWWKGSVLDESETLLIFKTTAGHFASIEDYIATETQAEVPEVLAMRPADVNSSYAEWVSKQVAG
jgi:periplasmic divalent cation tolerance protein